MVVLIINTNHDMRIYIKGSGEFIMYSANEPVYTFELNGFSWHKEKGNMIIFHGLNKYYSLSGAHNYIPRYKLYISDNAQFVYFTLDELKNFNHGYFEMFRSNCPYSVYKSYYETFSVRKRLKFEVYYETLFPKIAHNVRKMSPSQQQAHELNNILNNFFKYVPKQLTDDFFKECENYCIVSYAIQKPNGTYLPSAMINEDFYDISPLTLCQPPEVAIDEVPSNNVNEVPKFTLDDFKQPIISTVYKKGIKFVHEPSKEKCRSGNISFDLMIEELIEKLAEQSNEQVDVKDTK